MQRDRPSLTAWRVALRRAAHQLLDEPQVLKDPHALAIVGSRDAGSILATRHRYQRRADRRLRAFLVARSVFAEERLALAVSRGVRQYVVLGAGLDTFAYRNPHADLKVFEVDHPVTQAWKRRRLAEGTIPLPQTLRFVPTDFEQETLADTLGRCGFDAARPAFFSWLGVSMYLTRLAVMKTLGFVARLPPGSGIVFDYALPPSSLTPVKGLLYRAMLRRVAAVGEPWRTFLAPAPLASELHALGFGELEDLGPEEINARYFAQRNDDLKTAGPGRVLAAHR
jgi:methyltransferase (TIGR00027 family)